MAGSDLKVVVITGASGGIGATLAKQLGARGDTVVLGARRPAELESVARDAGPSAVAVPTDVTKRADVDRLREVALERCGQIDVWVNNAGRGITAPVLQLTDGQFDEMMAVNVKSALYGMQAIYPNVHVSLVMPGIVTTDFAANALGGTPWPRSSGGGTQFRGQTADEAAAAIVGLIDEPRDEIYTNPDQAETVRRYFEDVGAFEKQLQR